MTKKNFYPSKGHLTYLLLWLSGLAFVAACSPKTTQSVQMLKTLQDQKAQQLTTDDKGYIVQIGQKSPLPATLTLTDGSILQPADLNGKVVVLQFTASWCGVCRQEMPHLEREVWQTYKDKGLLLIGIDRDEPLDKVKAFAEQMKVTYPMALDPGADIFGLFADKKSGVTRNIVIDKQGNIAYLTRLYDEKEFSDMVQVIELLLK